MDVEILTVRIQDGSVYIHCQNVSEENLRRLERMRDDASEEEVIFVFDGHDPKDFRFLRSWLRNQKASKGADTWGQALQSVVGTITVIPTRYRLRSW